MKGIFKFLVFLLLLGLAIKAVPWLIEAVLGLVILLLIVFALVPILAVAGITYAFTKGSKTKRGRIKIEIGGHRIETGEHCPNCKAPIEADQIICTHCYEDLALNCPSCGEILSWREKSCPVCKTALRVTSRVR